MDIKPFNTTGHLDLTPQRPAAQVRNATTLQPVPEDAEQSAGMPPRAGAAAMGSIFEEASNRANDHAPRPAARAEPAPEDRPAADTEQPAASRWAANARAEDAAEPDAAAPTRPQRRPSL